MIKKEAYKKMSIETINVSSWEEFLDKVNKDTNEIDSLKKLPKNKHTHFSDLLYRGQTDCNWELKTTLERYAKDISFTWEEYHRILIESLPATDTFTDSRFNVPQKIIYEKHPVPNGYDYMIYLRHHNFPSPLLDWTRSIYVAAYFAFSPKENLNDPAIFTFREYVDNGKGHLVGDPEIQGLGPNVRGTLKRHHIQQCEYTICYKEERDENDIGKVSKRTYAPHESGNFSDQHNILKKYVIPRTERIKIMKDLDQMNINAFTLFGNEEGLANMLAYREIEKRLENRK